MLHRLKNCECFFLTSILLLCSTLADAGCKDLFKSLVNASKGYAAQVWQSGGARLLVKEMGDEKPDVKLFVFFQEPRESEPPGLLVSIFDSPQRLVRHLTERSQWGKPYEFHPGYAIIYHLIDRPVSYFSKKFLTDL